MRYGPFGLLTTFAAILTVHCQNASAVAEVGDGSLQTVVIVGARLPTMDVWFLPSVTITAGGIAAPYRGYRSEVASEMWFDYVELIQLTLANPLSTSDVRCSTIATAATKSTTSRSDPTDRFIAANQLFTAIRAYNGAIGIKAVISGSKPALVDGKYVPTFTITYIDGGKERWMVSPSVPETLIIDANVAPPPDGDGVPKACPTSPQG
jgi:hypothetical protein